MTTWIILASGWFWYFELFFEFFVTIDKFIKVFCSCFGSKNKFLIKINKSNSVFFDDPLRNKKNKKQTQAHGLSWKAIHPGYLFKCPVPCGWDPFFYFAILCLV